MPNIFNVTLAELLKRSNATPFQFFLIIIITGTGCAAAVINRSGTVIDWQDRGQIFILAVCAGASYLAVWIFIRRLLGKV